MYSVHKWGSPRGFGELGRRAFYFWEAGRNSKYLWGTGKQAPYFGELGSTIRLYQYSKLKRVLLFEGSYINHRYDLELICTCILYRNN